jgi:hypothetical protein
MKDAHDMERAHEEPPRKAPRLTLLSHGSG